VALAFAVASPLGSSAAAQGVNAMIEGVVKDPNGNGAGGAIINFVSANDGGTRKYNTKADKSGKFMLIGIYPTEYTITASLPSANQESLPATMRLTPGEISKIELNLNDKKAIAAAETAAAASPAAKAEAAARSKLGKAFEEGVAAASAGQHDLAIEKFTETLKISASCALCYRNMGYSYLQKKDYPQAEEAYKKAVELSPTPDAEALTGLANVYNALKKYELAADASAKAAAATPAAAPGAAGGGGGNPEALYAQGVNLYNANKGAEARAAFQAAIKANPNHAEAHYMLGLVLVGEGNNKAAITAFQTYLKLDPQGKNASIAKAALDSLK
jgi:tetratricopeptide (TPR) repeat protein